MFVKVKNKMSVDDFNAEDVLIQVNGINCIRRFPDSEDYIVSMVGDIRILTDQEGYDKILKIIDVEG